MSAETLRKAAKLLREHAEKATPGPWWTDGITVRGGGEGRGVASATNAYRPNAHHIATMHPGVGLALADWLDLVARLLAEGFDANAETQAALDVARQILILGGDS